MLISEFVSRGVRSLDDLKAGLQLAMQLEFATIPPYLCAQWSIRHDPDRVEAFLHRVVSEEMIHLGFAGNILSAIGGRPSVARPDFIPAFPATTLPGGIVQELPIDLKPLSAGQLEVFMQIEHPAFPPVALKAEDPPATIGDFYDTLIAAFKALSPSIDPRAHAVVLPGVRGIANAEEAIRVLDRIKSDGEGLQDSPIQPSRPGALAHYYAFKQIRIGRKLIERDDRWVFEGEPISMPAVYEFQPSRGPEATAEFRRTLSRLLVEMEAAWTDGRPLSVVSMYQLKLEGVKLIKAGIQPEFRWDASTGAEGRPYEPIAFLG